MRGLMKELEKLAPHPNHHQTMSGPAFSSSTGSDSDGMLGSMLLESLIGTAFMSAASDLPQVDYSNLADCASEYMQDRQKPVEGYQIGQKNVIAGAFNAQADSTPMMQAYLRDLPRRKGLEKWLAYYQRKLFAMNKHNLTYGLAA